MSTTTCYLLDSPYKIRLDNALIKMAADGTMQILKDRWTQKSECKVKVR